MLFSCNSESRLHIIRLSPLNNSWKDISRNGRLCLNRAFLCYVIKHFISGINSSANIAITVISVLQGFGHLFHYGSDMLAHRTKIVGTIANMLRNYPVFKRKLYGRIFEPSTMTSYTPGLISSGSCTCPFLKYCKPRFSMVSSIYCSNWFSGIYT